MIPQSCIDFIVSEETGGQAYYTKFACRPTWPGGASGVTIGVGYDLGQTTAQAFEAAWTGQIDSAAIERLASAIGAHGSTPDGEAKCKSLVTEFADLTISWAAANAVFSQHVLPTYIDRTLAAFPGLENLDGLCIGAMVSLVYNRGTSLVGSSRTEMQAIHDMIAAGKPDGVPDQFRAMKRLWPTVAGLQKRRDAEAAMFQQGLDNMAHAAAALPVA